jgi:hypothetical protein
MIHIDKLLEKESRLLAAINNNKVEGAELSCGEIGEVLFCRSGLSR